MLNNQQLTSLAKRNAKMAKKSNFVFELTEEFVKKSYTKYFRYGKYRSIKHSPNGYAHTHLQVQEDEKYPNHFVVEVVCCNQYNSIFETGIAYLVPKGRILFDKRIIKL